MFNWTKYNVVYLNVEVLKSSTKSVLDLWSKLLIIMYVAQLGRVVKVWHYSNFVGPNCIYMAVCFCSMLITLDNIVAWPQEVNVTSIKSVYNTNLSCWSIYSVCTNVIPVYHSESNYYFLIMQMLIVYHKLYTEHQMLYETCFRHILVCCWKFYDTCTNFGNIYRNLHRMNFPECTGFVFEN